VYSTLSSKVILKAIRSYGFNMRTLALVLSNGPKSVDKMIWDMANKFTPAQLRSTIASNLDAVGDPSHTIATTVCLEQPPSDYLGSDTPNQMIASSVVMNALLRAHGRATYTELIHLLAMFSSIPEARASAGWVWEHWANAQISKGGDFILNPITFDQPMAQSGPTTISVPPLTIRFFNAKEPPSDTRDSHYFFIPASKNNATFDAFLHHKVNGIGLQMTLSDAHSLKTDGLKKLYDRLQAYQQAQHMYVVVIPKGHTFKNFNPTPTPSQQKRFRFFTLELELPGGMCLFLP